MKNLLSTLLKCKRHDFIKNYSSHTQMIAHHEQGIIQEITELPFLNSLDDLLSFWTLPIDAYLPGISDEVNSETVTSKEAKALFDQGRGLIFNDANTESPLLEAWVQNIKADLGISALSYGRALIYALPPGSTTDAHFDQNINFVLQIKGSKKWWVAPNEQVLNPLTRHTMGTPTGPELASYSEEFPQKMPAGAKAYTLHPGSFLFVPRGVWHSTQASSAETISISFTFSAPTWMDLLMTALRGRLAQSPYWRETADFVTDEVKFEEATEKFDLLLAELALEIPSWDASDILRATELDKYPQPKGERA